MNFTIVFPLLLGWLAGWLVNYLADVLPASRRLGRPACPQCQVPYTWLEYLLFRNCKTCGKQRTVRALCVQAAATAAAVSLWIFPPAGFPFPAAFSLLVYLILVLVIDLEHRLILHPVSLVGAVLGLGIGVYLHSRQMTVAAGLFNTLIGGAFGFGVMLVFYFIGKWYVRRMSRKRRVSADEVALGFGDVNLAGMLGLLVGWPAIGAGLLLAIFAGGLVSLVIVVRMLISKKYNAFTAIPYAPFLILSAIYLLYLS